MPVRKPVRIGERYGKLTVIKHAPQKRKYFFRVLCQCDCGKQKEIDEGALRQGKTKSCGCLWSETVHKSLPNGEARRNQLYNNYKTRAKKKGISFTLTSYDFHELTAQSCHYCGKEPSQIINSKYHEIDILRRKLAVAEELLENLKCCGNCKYYYAEGNAPNCVSASSGNMRCPMWRGKAYS